MCTILSSVYKIIAGTIRLTDATKLESPVFVIRHLICAFLRAQGQRQRGENKAFVWL